MKLTLNPFVLVVKMNDTYNFILSDHTNPLQLKPMEKQRQILDRMNNGEFYSYEELSGCFGDTFVDALMKEGCFVPDSIDTNSLYSRTNAFFLTHNMPDARTKLSDKKVIILGCGGIGTHMAWHMVTLGVSKITLVDFDTVEVSNLNRQLLFEVQDAGKIKTDVLKVKLEAINKDIVVETIQAKIMSEDELENICLSDDYDLIIKALDSPPEFPIWLDNVARKHNLTYIAGITMRENVLIGPSYIPGKSTYGWSDLMDIKGNTAEKVYGIAPSLGVMLYHISDELAIEAFKILTGYGQSKYTDRILCKNIITDEEHIFQKGVKVDDKESAGSKNVNWKTLMLNILLMAFLAVAGTQIGWFVPVSLIVAMVLPFFIYRTSQDVVRCTFINATILSIGLLVRFIGAANLTSLASFVSTLVMLFGVHSAVTLFACVINYFGHKFFFRTKKWLRRRVTESNADQTENF